MNPHDQIAGYRPQVDPAARRAPVFPWLLAASLLLIVIALLSSPTMVDFARRQLKIASPANERPMARPAPRQTVAAAPVRAQPQAAMATTPVLAPGAALDAADLSRLEGRVGALTQRMERLDLRSGAALANADRAEGMLLALAARRAIETGKPLGVVEGMLRNRFGGTNPNAVAALITAAQRPVTLPQLQARFATLAGTLRTGTDVESWWSTVRRELGGLIVVRHADAPPATLNDRLTGIEARLGAGDVAGAAAIVARLPGPQRQQAAPWLTDANRYIAARNALDLLETVALLAPSPASGEAIVPLPQDPPLSAPVAPAP